MNERQRKTDTEAAAAKEDLPAQIAKMESELRGLEEARERLHESLTMLTKQADTRVRLALKRTELIRAEEMIADQCVFLFSPSWLE